MDQNQKLKSEKLKDLKDLEELKELKELKDLEEIIKRKLEEQRKDNYNMILPGVKGLIVSISSIVLYSWHSAHWFVKGMQWIKKL